ncbi:MULTISPECIES: hypothetical protein [unclassified Streptomyces]|uniref:hypothetical protein n=1 Tax=unclassified Streptomyces TaxID=2593676 RepID=UPI0036C89315
MRHSPAALAAERNHHRQALHGGHHPDGERAGEVDRAGRWYADLDLFARLHARLTDTYADVHDPKGSGAPLWARALAWLTLITGAATVLWTTTAVLQP